jgi:outer membrane protein OmpA-like peptidoglycan-associated protein
MKSIKFIIVPIFLLVLFIGNSVAQVTPDDASYPWSYRLFVAPLSSKLTSNQFKAEEKAGLGFNLGGDVVYTFYQKNKLRLNTSLGLGITNYNNKRQGDYINKGWASEYEQTLNTQQSFYLTETLKGINESQHFTYLNIPVKLGIDYAFTQKWAGFATVGISYGINLGANYTSTATITRTGLYTDYNVLLHDVDVEGSPYYYPTNKAVFGSGKINAKSNLGLEATMGVKCKLNPIMSLYGGVKWMNGLQNAKTSPATTIMATSATTLNTLASRNDIVETRALGLELGVQINFGNSSKHIKKVVQPVIQYATFTVNIQPPTNPLVVKRNGEVEKTLAADAYGKYKLDLPKGKIFVLEATAPGYVSQNTTIDLTGDASAVQKDISLTLVKQNATLTGKAFDVENSAPVKATLTVKSNGQVVKTVEAGNDGQLNFELPTGIVYELVVAAPGYVPQQQKIDLTGNENVGNKDFALIPEINGVQLIAIALDSKTAAPVEATIVVKDNDIIAKSAKADQSSTIKVVVPEGKSYEIEVSAPGYITQRQIVDLTTVPHSMKKEINLYPLVKIEKGLVLTFQNVNFKRGKAKLTPEDLIILESVSTILIENPTLHIEILGHTDNVGRAVFNMHLSNKRANAVMRYFVKKGAKPEQMKAFGYGETKPLVSNKTAAGKAQNRRIEFKVVDIK